MIGSRVNNYEIVSVLGEGGMGTVYLAVHPVMGRKAAIKLLRRELAEDQTLVARFVNEARAANAIRHPNIIDVIDVGTLPDNGLPYMMMEFLEGENLAQRLARTGTLPVSEAIDIALQTASALSAAHGKGIVHRDLKPDNLFLVPELGSPGRERVKVLDFGIAKLRGDTSSGAVKTNSGSIMGTPPYMSPEQCRGIAEDIDHRADIYALGIILFEMLCGRPPFVSPGFGELLMMHLTRPPPSPRELNGAIPEPVEQIILRALSKKPEDRFASMDEFCSSLSHAGSTAARTGPVTGLSDGQVRAREGAHGAGPVTTFSTATGQIGGPKTQTAERSRRPLVLVGIAAAAVVAVGAAVVGMEARRTPAVRLADGALHRVGDLIGVHDHLALDVACCAPDRLDQ